MLHIAVCSLHLGKYCIKLVYVSSPIMYVNDRICDLGAKAGEDAEKFLALKAHGSSICKYWELESLGLRFKPVWLQAGRSASLNLRTLRIIIHPNMIPVLPATSDDLKSWEAVLLVKHFVTTNCPIITNVPPSLPLKWGTKEDVVRRETLPSWQFGVGLALPGRPWWPPPELTDAGRGPGVLSNTPVRLSLRRWVPRYQDPVPFSDYTCSSISGQMNHLPLSFSGRGRWIFILKTMPSSFIFNAVT